MPIKLRGVVRSTRTKIAGWAWAATATDDQTGKCTAIKYGYEPTMHEAFAKTHTALGQIHNDLMAEVYADRAARRAVCTCLWNRSQQGHESRCALADIHTMEPTA